MSDNIILKADNLGICFANLKAVDNFNISIREKEIIGLIGPNGAGKTTIFNLLTNVYVPTQGNIELCGKNTAKMSPHKLSKLGIARTFQNIRLFKDMTVIENVKIGMHNSIKYSVLEAMFRLPSHKRQEKELEYRAMNLLDELHLTKYAYHKAGSLPYGIQRRVEIARALATNPKILLLDEPAAGLNPTETNHLMNSIRNIRDKFGISIVLIEHDMKLVMGTCERIVVLNYGKIIAQGSPEEISNNDNVIEAYLRI